MRVVLPERTLDRARWDGESRFTRFSRSTIRHTGAAVDHGGRRPSYWGMFEDNDPRKRLIAIANVNNDISEYWEFSDTGFCTGRSRRTRPTSSG